ncbi:Polynucleotide 5'-hydroxyl-kinase grc3 [Coemansia javaensis]|uniref:Polynucleotide 5'-hydroxyl-kinase GRC3 n=1 Tax=Coemansia javaensis TaxID=2761396 RepID=A0A9W8LFF4_9FUNG|nr:Polynucleotide 5'-hydroxyl-kinase grc3 [Coemansia javaensis]
MPGGGLSEDARGSPAATAWGLPAATTWSPASATRVVAVGAAEGPNGRTLSAIGASVSPEERYGVVFDIPDGEAVVFQGIVDVCVLEGAVSAYAYTLTPRDQWVRMFSPSSHPLITLRAAGGRQQPSEGGELDGEMAQMHRLWHEGAGPPGTAKQRPAAVVALRTVSCGLENIGLAAEPFRNIFALKPFVERRGSGLPKKHGKRRIALARIESAAKAIKLGGEAAGRAAASDSDAHSDSPSDAGSASEDSDVAAVVEYAQQELALAHCIGLAGFDPVSRVTPDLQLLQTPSDWAEVLDQAGSAALQLDNDFEPISPVYVVAGGAGLGKSTFSRQLVNRLIGRYGRVFYMETDLGQPELAPPGALSLTMLDRPLFGPPFTHVGQTEPYHAVYMGANTPKNDPDRYSSAVKRLAEVYRDYASSARVARDPDGAAAGSSEHVVPLVVNTQGWLKGLGLDLHYSLCEDVRPTNYIQMYDPAAGAASAQSQDEYDAQSWGGSGGGQQAPFVDFESIADCNPQLSWISAMNFERAMLAAQQGLPGNSAPAAGAAGAAEPGAGELGAPPAEASGRKGPRLTARDTRALALLSHLYAESTAAEPQQWNAGLCRLADMSWGMRVPLASRCPLVVPWADLVLWLGEEDIPPSQIPRALNGTVVGVIGVAVAPSPDAHVWTDAEVRSLYPDGGGISDQAAVELSEPGSRVLLRADVAAHQAAHAPGSQDGLRLPQIVYGHPSTDATTFLAHALVRSVDADRGHVHLLLPPLVASAPAHADGAGAPLGTPLSRIVGLLKGPGLSVGGLELPVWAMVDGGYATRAMGFSAMLERQRFAVPRASRGQQPPSHSEGPANLGIQEAPYMSVEADEGVGASSSRPWGGHMRRAHQN